MQTNYSRTLEEKWERGISAAYYPTDSFITALDQISYTTATSSLYQNTLTAATLYENYNSYADSSSDTSNHFIRTNADFWSGDASWVQKPIDPTARIRELIRSRQAPLFVSHRKVSHPVDIREFRARETLRRMIGDKAFQDYLKKGFTSVRAKSGRIYQVFPGHGMTRVWENGKHIQTLCVILKSNFAPTDSVIMRYILIQTDEADFWARANKFGSYPVSQRSQRTIDFRPLTEIFAELKVA